MGLELILNSPVGSEPLVYNWPLSSGRGKNKFDGSIEIAETIRLVCAEFPALGLAMGDNMFEGVNWKTFESMKELCDGYNMAVNSMLQLEEGSSKRTERVNQQASQILLKHIIQQVYNKAVIDPKKLNQYQPFSSEVYGETSFEAVTQMIDEVKIKKEDIFGDMGSGVGQVVLQVAAATKCQFSFGIEKAEVPSTYAKEMDTQFKKLMKWYGKRHGEYLIIKGDFLSEEFREKITSATIIFTNNLSFEPTVDHMLKEKFAELKDGAKIISSKSFSPLNFRITDRNLSDIGAIMHVSELHVKGSVSWTNKSISYYIHSIDRSRLELYFARLNSRGKYSASLHRGRGRPRKNSSMATTKSYKNGQPNCVGKATEISSSSEGSASDSASEEVEINNANGVGTEESYEVTNLSAVGAKKRDAHSDRCFIGGKRAKETFNDDAAAIMTTRTYSQQTKRTNSDGEKKRIERKIFVKKVVSGTNWQQASSIGCFLPPPPIQATASGASVAVKRLRGRPTKRQEKKVAETQWNSEAAPLSGLDLLATQALLHARKMVPPATGPVADIPTTAPITFIIQHVDPNIRGIDIGNGNALQRPTTAPTPFILQHEEPNVRDKDISNALQQLLDNYRKQFLDAIEMMKAPGYRETLVDEINRENTRREQLRMQRDLLNKDIELLYSDSTGLLKTKLEMLHIPGENAEAENLLKEARNAVTGYTNLMAEFSDLHQRICHLTETKEMLEEKIPGRGQ